VDPELVSKDNCPAGTHDGYRPHKEFPHVCEDVEVKSLSVHDKGLFASKFLPKGTIIIDWDYELPAFTCAQLDEMEQSGELTEVDKRYLWQIEDDVVLVDPGSNYDLDAANFINHSCDANCGIRCLHMLETLRDIEAGEELFFDYGTCEGGADATMTCLCHSKHCRGEVSGNDWKNAAFRARFGRRFLPFILRKIDALEAEEKRQQTKHSDSFGSGCCGASAQCDKDNTKSECKVDSSSSSKTMTAKTKASSDCGGCGSLNEVCCTIDAESSSTNTSTSDSGCCEGGSAKKHKSCH